MSAPTLSGTAEARDHGGDVRPELGFWHRVALTFSSPRTLFAAFPQGPPWAGVLVLSTVIAMIAAAAQPPEYFLAQMENAVNRRGAPVEITSEPGEIVRWGRYLAAMSAAAGHPLVVLALAGLLTLLFGFSGGTPRFGHYLPVAAYASLVLALGAAVTAGLIALTGNPGAEPTLAGLLGPVGTRFPLLGAINLFTLWTGAVMAIGVSVLDRRASWLGPATILLAFYLVLASVATLLALR